MRVAATAAVLIDGGEDYNLLHLAHFKLLDRLEAEMGDRINDLFSVYDAEPTSLLHMAVRDDFPDVGRWLLERGANPDLVDANGLTPKQVAVTTDRSDAQAAGPRTEAEAVAESPHKMPSQAGSRPQPASSCQGS